MKKYDNTDYRNLSGSKPILDPSDAIRIELMIEELVKAGLSEADARMAVEKRFEIIQHQKVETQKRDEKVKKETRYLEYAGGAALLVAVPMGFIHSPAGYVLAIIAGGIAGYYANPKKALAGIIGTISGVVLSALISHMYFYNRHSYRVFELFVPVIPSAIVAYLLIKIISLVFYKNKS
jgi:uncharacterized membrane protein YeaQ/YmgE (transglycosylase-associated protein family)